MSVLRRCNGVGKHGYEVHADEVFWVNQGILRSTDLRDSMDEQCIADIAACILGQDLIERSKDALDTIYERGSAESERIITALEIYGAGKFRDEFNFCIQELIKTADGKKLRDIVFQKKTSNPFPSVFAAILIAFHELIIGESKKVADYEGVRQAISGLSERVDTTRKATSPDERRKNIDTIKGLITKHFVDSKDDVAKIYGNHTVVDVEAIVRRSEIELSNYELKQGLLILEPNGAMDHKLVERLAQTICAIANNGPNSYGKILLGVSDKLKDAEKVSEVDGIESKSRFRKS